jgi:hypothetical protein
VTIAFYRYSIDLMLRTGAKPAPTPGEITRQMTPRRAEPRALDDAMSARAVLTGKVGNHQIENEIERLLDDLRRHQNMPARSLNAPSRPNLPSTLASAVRRSPWAKRA